MPSVGMLLRDGFAHWSWHQRGFWFYAALAVAAIVFAKTVIQGGGAGVVAAMYILAFDQWLKVAMFPDWKARARTLGRSPEGRRLSHPRLGFWAFGFAYGLVVLLGSLFLISVLAPRLAESPLDRAMMLSYACVAVATILATLLFARFFLFLPAGIAGAGWSVGDAFRQARAVRAPLVGLALLCTLIALVGPLVAVLATTLLQQAPQALFIAVEIVATIVDLLALYLMAYGIARLFAVRTGWKPEPLPDDAS